MRNTVSSTVFLGRRLWPGGEDLLQSRANAGLWPQRCAWGGRFSPMGRRRSRVSAYPRFNAARLFLSQTIGLGGEKEIVEDGPNQIAGERTVSRLTITVGKFAVTRLFPGQLLRGRAPHDVSQLERLWRRLIRLDHGQAELDLGRTGRAEPEALGFPGGILSASGRIQLQHLRYPYPAAWAIHGRTELRYCAIRQAGQAAAFRMAEPWKHG